MCPPIVEDAEHEQHGERGEGCEHQQALHEPAPDRRMRQKRVRGVWQRDRERAEADGEEDGGDLVADSHGSRGEEMPSAPPAGRSGFRAAS